LAYCNSFAALNRRYTLPGNAFLTFLHISPFDHEHQNRIINSSLVVVIIGDWKLYNHQGLCFNSKRSIRVGWNNHLRESLMNNYSKLNSFILLQCGLCIIYIAICFKTFLKLIFFFHTFHIYIQAFPLKPSYVIMNKLVYRWIGVYKIILFYESNLIIIFKLLAIFILH